MSGEIWFTSDTHFGHQSLVEFRNKTHGTSFADSTEMDIQLFQNLDNNIGSRDSVWHLGDVVWGNWEKNSTWLKMLRGHWKLVAGNHDTHDTTRYLEFFKRVVGMRKVKGFMMSHCPLHPQELSYRNWPYNVHGHIHHKGQNLPREMYFNVNVDVNGLMPVHLDTILKRWDLPHGGD